MTDGKELIKGFIELAEQHGQTLLDGDSKKGNKLHSLLTRRINQIKNLGKDDKKHFYELLNHDNDSVRIWTAIELSATFPEKAHEVLKSINQNQNIFGLTPQSMLDMIAKGMIKKEGWEKD